MSTDLTTDSETLQSAQFPKSPTDKSSSSCKSQDLSNPQFQDSTNLQPPPIPDHKPKTLQKSVTFEDLDGPEVFSPIKTDQSGSGDPFTSPFGEDPFSSAAFSSDPFESDTPFSNDTPFSEAEDPFKSTDFLTSEGSGDFFHKFNVGVSTQTSVDPSMQQNSKVEVDLLGGNEMEEKSSADLGGLDFGGTDQVVLRKTDSVKSDMREASSFIELSKYFPESEASGGQADDDKTGNLFSNEFEETKVMKNSMDGLLSDAWSKSSVESAGDVKQGKADKLQDNFSLLQDLSTSLTVTPGTSDAGSLPELTVTKATKTEDTGDKLADNFAFIQNLSVKDKSPKLEEIKQHSASSSFGDYDDCSFMKTSVDEGEVHADDEYDDLSDIKRSCNPSPQTEKEVNPTGQDDYDDLGGYIRNSEITETDIIETADQYDEFDFVKPDKKTENSEVESDIIQDENYEEVLNCLSAIKAGKKLGADIPRDDEYDDFTVSNSDKTLKDEAEEIQEDLYSDIVEYAKFEKSNQGDEQEDVNENFNFLQSLSRKAPTKPEITAQAVESDEDDTYEPIEKFRSLRTESSDVSGQV